MIITKIIGGLGNQMFQYAAGKSLALKNDTFFSLDVTAFDNYNLHQGFELQRIFNCDAMVSTKNDAYQILGWQSSPAAQRILSKNTLSFLRKKMFIVEPHYNYWDGINRCTKDCYISGYWQSEKYFLDVESQIRSDFIFKLPMDTLNRELAEKIGTVNAVSLHVRRGDYISNPKAKAAHGLCSIEYYNEAIKHIKTKIDNPCVFVFSDDIEWVMNNLKIEIPYQYVDHNSHDESYNDMRLMSLCKHHIIANSSFSWWGAWLNPSEDKIVVAPKKWFANKNDISDLIPEGWVLF